MWHNKITEEISLSAIDFFFFSDNWCYFYAEKSKAVSLIDYSWMHTIKARKKQRLWLFHKKIWDEFALQVNDLPDFLRGKHRELCQHIRITYVTEEPDRRRALWLSKGQRSRLPPAKPPSRQTSHCPPITRTFEGNPRYVRWPKSQVRFNQTQSGRVAQLTCILWLQFNHPVFFFYPTGDRTQRWVLHTHTHTHTCARARSHTYMCADQVSHALFKERETSVYLLVVNLSHFSPTKFYETLTFLSIYLSNYVANALCFQGLDICFVFYLCSCGLNTSGLWAECL